MHLHSDEWPWLDPLRHLYKTVGYNVSEKTNAEQQKGRKKILYA